MEDIRYVLLVSRMSVAGKFVQEAYCGLGVAFIEGGHVSPGRFEDTLRSKKNKPVNRRRAAIHVLNRMQGLQMGTAQAGKWRLVLGKEEMTSRLQDLFWRNANMIAAVSGTIYKDPQPDTRTKLPSTNLAGDQGS